MLVKFFATCRFFNNFVGNTKCKIKTKQINRIKVVLVQGVTGKCLAQQLEKDTSAVSKWCTNVSQPNLQTLRKIAGLLDIDIKDLIYSRK